MSDPFDTYCASTCDPGYLDPYPGPAWSYRYGNAGSANGSGYGSAGVPSQLPSGTDPSPPEAGRRHFGGGRGGSWQHPDKAAREILRHGDDLTRLHGQSGSVYGVIADTDAKAAAHIETLIDDITSDDVTLKVAVPMPRDGDDKNPEAELAAQILGECQDSLDRLRPHLDEVLRPVLESMFVEFDGAAEPVWEAVKGADGKASYRLKSLATLPRCAWEFVVDRANAVAGYAGIGLDGRPSFVSTSGLAVMSYRPKAGRPGGRAMLRPVHAWWNLQNRMMDPYFQHVYHFSDPYRIGKVKAKSFPRQAGIDPPAMAGDPQPNTITANERMFHVLAMASSAGFAVCDAEDDITTQYPQGGGEAYLNLFKLAAENITQGIVGDLRAVEGGPNATFASAKVGAGNKGVRVSYGRRTVCRFVEGVLRTQNEMNHGVDVSAKLTPFVLFRDPEEATKAGEWPGWEPTEQQKAEIDIKLGLTPRIVGTEESLKDRKTQVEIAEAWVNIGAPVPWAAKQAGLSEEEIGELEEALAQRKAEEEAMLADQEETETETGDGLDDDPESPEDSNRDDPEDGPPTGLFSLGRLAVAFAGRKPRSKAAKPGGRPGGVRKPHDPSKHPKGEGGRFKDVPGAGNDAPKAGSKPAQSSGEPSASKFVGKAVGKAEQVYADKQEQAIAKAVGGKQLEDNEPLDVRVNRSDGGEHAIEVKSLLKGSKQAISVHDDALLRKVEYAKANPISTFHTIVVDHRDRYDGGAHKDGYSGHGVYYRRGNGRFSLAKMHKVKDEAELKALLDTPDGKLPAAARGSLPGRSAIVKLRESADKTHESRLRKDRARKARIKAERQAVAP